MNLLRQNCSKSVSKPTQPFILSGSINEQWAAIKCPPPHSVESPSGECLRDKGWHGVLCRLKVVWSMPELFKVVCTPCKALYKCSAFLPFYTDALLSIQPTDDMQNSLFSCDQELPTSTDTSALNGTAPAEIQTPPTPLVLTAQRTPRSLFNIRPLPRVSSRPTVTWKRDELEFWQTRQILHHHQLRYKHHWHHQ